MDLDCESQRFIILFLSFFQLFFFWYWVKVNLLFSLHVTAYQIVLLLHLGIIRQPTLKQAMEVNNGDASIFVRCCHFILRSPFNNASQSTLSVISWFGISGRKFIP